jgi:hypothetical protein
MLLAALNGKVPSILIKSEDILTSNVFSFFKYSKRTTYLKSLLAFHAIYPTDTELKTAEFRFWPRYDDSTEPDVVIIVGNYYLLFEAKHLSDFGAETDTRKGQVNREIEGGMNEAHSLEKEFFFITITSHYNKPKMTLDQFWYGDSGTIRWMNWQAVARLLLDILEKDSVIPDRSFAEDLYNLLDKMKLRSFLPFQRINAEIAVPPDHIFFSARSAQFRGDFIGFKKALGNEMNITAPTKWLFYQHEYFKGFSWNLDLNEEFSLGGNIDDSES